MNVKTYGNSNQKICFFLLRIEKVSTVFLCMAPPSIMSLRDYRYIIKEILIQKCVHFFNSISGGYRSNRFRWNFGVKSFMDQGPLTRYVKIYFDFSCINGSGLHSA